MYFLNPLGELEKQIEKVLKNWRTFWRNRVTSLNCQDIQWTYRPIEHPKQRDSNNCGIYTLKFAEQIIVSENAQFPNSSQDLNDYRRVIAEELIAASDHQETGWCRVCGTYRGDTRTISCTSCNRWIHWKCKGESSVNGDGFECAVCINALTLETDKHTAAVPVAQSSPVSTKEKNKCRLEPTNAYKMRLMITTSKTRAARCEQCKAPFKEKGIVRQRLIVGNYGPRPYSKKATGTWHNGTRNYYYCARKKCLTKVKQDINDSDLDISFVKNELFKADFETLAKNGLQISV
eukprot:gene17106-18828_t